MSKQRQKYLASLTGAQQSKIKDIIAMIEKNQRSTLDIMPMKGEKNVWRCRVGDLRIVFRKDDQWDILISKLLPRGDIYKS